MDIDNKWIIKNNLRLKTVSGFIWMVSGKGIRYLLQLIIIAVLARLLIPEDFGIVTAALVVVSFSEIFSRLGIGPALVQRTSIKISHIKTSFTFSILLGFLFAAIVYALADYITMFFRIEGLLPVLRILSSLFVIHGTGVTVEALLQRELRFKWLTIASVLSYLIGYGVIGIPMAFLDYGVWALVSANISQALVKVVIEYLGYPNSVKLGFDLKALKELLFFGTGFTIARVFNYLALQGDNLIVGRSLGAPFLGLYSRAYQLMAMPANLFGDVLDKVLFPAMAKVQHDVNKLAAIFLQGVFFIALFVLPASAFVYILAPEIVLVFLGPTWIDIIKPVQVLSVGMYFRTSYKMSESLARATGAVYQRAWRQGVYALSIILGTWIGHHWGLVGVSTGVVIALALNFMLMVNLSIKLTRLKVTQIINSHVSALAITIIVIIELCLVTYLLRHTLALPSITILISLLIVVLTYLTIIWVYPKIIISKDSLWILVMAQNYIPFKHIDKLMKRIEQQR